MMELEPQSTSDPKQRLSKHSSTNSVEVEVVEGSQFHGPETILAVNRIISWFRARKLKRAVRDLQSRERRMAPSTYWMIVSLCLYLKFALLGAAVWSQVAFVLNDPNMMMNNGETVRRAIFLGIELEFCPGIGNISDVAPVEMQRVKDAHSLESLDASQFVGLDKDENGVIELADFLDNATGRVTFETLNVYTLGRFGREFNDVGQDLDEAEWTRAKRILGVDADADSLSEDEFTEFYHRLFLSPFNDFWIMHEDTCPISTLDDFTHPCADSYGCRGSRCGTVSEECGRLETTGMQGHVHSLGNMYTVLVGGHCMVAFVVSWLGLIPMLVRKGSAYHVQVGRAFVAFLLLQLFTGVTAGFIIVCSRGMWTSNYIGFNATSFPLVLYLQFAFLGSCMVDFLYCGLTVIQWKIWVPRPQWTIVVVICCFNLFVTWYWGISIIVAGVNGFINFGKLTELGAYRRIDEITFHAMFIVYTPIYLGYTTRSFLLWLGPSRSIRAHTGRSNKIVVTCMYMCCLKRAVSVPRLTYRLTEWRTFHAENMVAVAALAAITFLANICYRSAAWATPVCWLGVELIKVTLSARAHVLTFKARRTLKRGKSQPMSKCDQFLEIFCCEPCGRRMGELWM